MNRFIVTLLFFISSVIVEAQTADIPYLTADRPGMATTADIVLPLKFQIETGCSFEKMSSGNTYQENILYNTSLLRFGINENAEIRLQTDFAQVKTESSSLIGFNPLTIGTKLKLTEGNSWLPKTSLLLNLTLPWVGKKDFRPDKLSPSFYLLMQNNITDKLNICYNVGVQDDAENSTPQEFVALCFGYSFTDRLSAFIESYNWFEANTPPANSFDLGCACLIGKNIQIDVSGNMNVQGFRNYFMVNCGLAWRIMKRTRNINLK